MIDSPLFSTAQTLSKPEASGRFCAGKTERRPQPESPVAITSKASGPPMKLKGIGQRFPSLSTTTRADTLEKEGIVKATKA